MLGQLGWHKLQPLHTETCNLACTNLLMNPDCTPKTSHPAFFTAQNPQTDQKLGADMRFQGS